MRRRILLAVVAAVLVLGVLWTTRGPGLPSANLAGTFAFAVLGDAPYDVLEDLQYRLVLQDLDRHELSFVLHIGDIFWRPCSDARYERSLTWFDGLRHPVVYTPGDNEWADCWEPGSGGFGPRERLDRIRSVFFADPTHSLGGTPLSLARQSAQPAFSELVEHARFSHDGIVFATVHLVGSQNGMRPFPGRTPADDDEVRRRTEAATAWLRETFAEAASMSASAVVIAFHANPGFREPADDPYRQAYEPFLAALEEEVERFGGPVLMVHGDTHDYTVDRPLARRTTGRALENLTRLEVPGSPAVGWVRVVVDPGAENPFTFESRVVPRFKYW